MFYSSFEWYFHVLIKTSGRVNQESIRPHLSLLCLPLEEALEAPQIVCTEPSSTEPLICLTSVSNATKLRQNSFSLVRKIFFQIFGSKPFRWCLNHYRFPTKDGRDRDSHLQTNFQKCIFPHKNGWPIPFYFSSLFGPTNILKKNFAILAYKDRVSSRGLS